MTDIFDHPAGATPLTEEDREGLIPTWVATREDLNRAERDNIASATLWLFRRRWNLPHVTQSWLKTLHERMLAEVWDWAGAYRGSDTNIGCPWFEIPEAVEILLGDLYVQVDRATWPPDEIAIRFHHRLVAIHPFRNGNGRHARLSADAVVTILGGARFAWGSGSSALSDDGKDRHRYLTALREADETGTCESLIAFARGLR